ncbi:YitT family protein [Azospirillum doebereinerae]|uniref:YitT family protein n=1 Tax=Azospirillum doebereinerae TaxID=92933 RepID=A0A3S0VHP3_9PROT|nr:YitT family protein [Azospirillum doebereinerae]RUQ69760.1 YitT family protein [Azospirillum doebereinerae]
MSDTIATPTSPAAQTEVERHQLYEDALAMLLGTLFIALGMMLYAKTMLLTGSIAGVALLLSYVTPVSFGSLFFLINLPFYALAWKRLGWRFTLRTFIAVGLVTLFSRMTESWIGIAHLDPVYATVVGGGLCGTGLLMLFRHRTGLGGVNILAIYLQERYGVRAGYFQLAVDLAILAAAFFVLTPDRLLLSVVGATIVNMILAINHKPGRYLGVT